jgi:hypothetical protein
MKKIIVSAILISTTFFVQSCNNQKITPEITNSETNKGVFQDQTVTLDYGLTQKIIDQTPEDFLLELSNKNSVSSARISGEYDLGITQKELIDYYNSKMVNYPQFDMEKMQITQFGVLKKDFPEIKTKEDAFLISNKIVDFYDVILKNHLKTDIEQLKKQSKKGKVAVGIGDANSMELSYSAMFPVAGAAMYNGVKDADTWTAEKYPLMSLDLDNYVNSYRHTIWNMASAARMLKSGHSKSTTMSFVRDFTTIHEMEYKGNTSGIKPSPLPTGLLLLHLQWGLKTYNSTAMDLSNNAIGRSLIEDQVSYKLFQGWQKVDKASIVATMATKSSNPASYNQSNDIINTYHGGAWNTLASNIYDGITTSLYKIN